MNIFCNIKLDCENKNCNKIYKFKWIEIFNLTADEKNENLEKEKIKYIKKLFEQYSLNLKSYVKFINIK